jgi:hypothetical protein
MIFFNTLAFHILCLIPYFLGWLQNKILEDENKMLAFKLVVIHAELHLTFYFFPYKNLSHLSLDT